MTGLLCILRNTQQCTESSLSRRNPTFKHNTVLTLQVAYLWSLYANQLRDRVINEAHILTTSVGTSKPSLLCLWERDAAICSLGPSRAPPPCWSRAALYSRGGAVRPAKQLPRFPAGFTWVPKATPLGGPWVIFSSTGSPIPRLVPQSKAGRSWLSLSHVPHWLLLTRP